MARGSCWAKAPPPPRVQPKSHFELYCKITRSLSLSIWWISGIRSFSGNRHTLYKFSKKALLYYQFSNKYSTLTAVCVFLPVWVRVWIYSFICIIMISVPFLDGYCSTVQGLLDWPGPEVVLVRVWTRMYSFVCIIMISVSFALPTSKRCVTVCCLMNWVLTTRLLQWLSWVLATQERKKERKKYGVSVEYTLSSSREHRSNQVTFSSVDCHSVDYRLWGGFG